MPSTTTPRPWSSQEDALLTQAVALHGDAPGTWKAIAASVPGRTNKACRKRWLHSLSPTIRKTPWTPAEDALLLKLYPTHSPPRWSLIARHIPGRTDDACAKRYREALDPQLKKDDWTPGEDARLVELVAHLGPRWTQVGQAMGRSGLGCRNRWRLLQRKQRPRNTLSQGQHSPDFLSLAQDDYAATTTLLDQTIVEPSSSLIQQPPPGSISTASSLSGALTETYREASHCSWIDPELGTAPECSSSPTPAPITAALPQPSESPAPPDPPQVGAVVQGSSLGGDPSSHYEHLSSTSPTSRRPRARYATTSEGATELPRLSSHLPADINRTVQPYACGHSACWPGRISCFATASELAEHRRVEHPGDDGLTLSDDGAKPYRCALLGCGKGWKNINGIQYHLQISKAHFKSALTKAPVVCETSLDFTNGETGASVDSTTPTMTVLLGKRKEHPCPHEGCPNSYKQRTGLQYHLAHGHPANLAQLDVIPPALMRKMKTAGADAPSLRDSGADAHEVTG